MKCAACKFDGDNVRDEEGFLQLGVHLAGSVTAKFPHYEAPDIQENVTLWACPKCGTVRIDSWRLEG